MSASAPYFRASFLAAREPPKLWFNRSASGYGSTYYNEGAYRRESAGCCDADFCTTLCLANLLCNLCGGCR